MHCLLLQNTAETQLLKVIRLHESEHMKASSGQMLVLSCSHCSFQRLFESELEQMHARLLLPVRQQQSEIIRNQNKSLEGQFKLLIRMVFVLKILIFIYDVILLTRTLNMLLYIYPNNYTRKVQICTQWPLYYVHSSAINETFSSDQTPVKL